jgi:hypothetical protein
MSEVESTGAAINTESTAISPNGESNDGVETQESENQDGVKTAKPQTPVQKRIEKFKFKIDGEETEEEVDLDDRENLQKELQLARAAKKRMAEAQDAKRKAFEIAQAFEKDPASILRRLGAKGREAAEMFLLEHLQEEALTPEQKQYRQMQQELDGYRNKDKEAKERSEQERISKLESDQAQHYQSVIIEALEKSDLPKSPENVKRMAFLLRQNLKLGLDLSPEELAQEAKNDVTSYLGSMFKNASAETIIKVFGPEILKKLRQHDIEQFKKTKLGGMRPSSSSKTTSDESVNTKKDYLTPDEWLAETNKRLGLSK